MSGWELTLIAPSTIDLDAAVMSVLETGSNEKELCRVELPSSRPGKSILLGDLFRVRNRDDGQIVINGDVKFLHRLGIGWTNRSLLIEGDVGVGLGTQMRGGSITVHGNALESAACQMRGGLIRILGNTGDYLGGPLPGRRSGMSGGRVVISGNVGHHAGHRMRRGTIVIAGDSGVGVASDMVAGTIAIGGKVGNFVAAGMRRGTLILKKPATLDPVRFTKSRKVDLSISRLIAVDLHDDAPELASALNGPMNRCYGDRSAGGQGEVWFC